MNGEGDNHSLVEPFEIEDGEFAGLRPDHVFSLGVEWEQFRQQILRRPGTFIALCMAHNAERFVRMAQRHGRHAEVTKCACPEYWSAVFVGCNDPNCPECSRESWR